MKLVVELCSGVMLRVVLKRTIGKCRVTNTSFYCTEHLTKEKEKCRYVQIMGYECLRTKVITE